ncbi:hypothetical protein VFPFJ_11115 [Purpureocillium lilacinum]|uniref:Uncharacterized protein n=1 Tax=Purpureocillium lilacinum TaxID=33203 RepID=A0A179FPH3_PURLI|nr:hypothetical protein VFPFJ_11115 [Purpureocillium lilacinum]OAQ67526.1 hypothetical protein VFPFJ_11115 [Purpureocillium lilacinum]OAQ69427.1 hypothetical protein VFPBJ_10802 [Purpureocillium lilacinum]
MDAMAAPSLTVPGHSETQWRRAFAARETRKRPHPGGEGSDWNPPAHKDQSPDKDKDRKDARATSASGLAQTAFPPAAAEALLARRRALSEVPTTRETAARVAIYYASNRERQLLDRGTDSAISVTIPATTGVAARASGMARCLLWTHFAGSPCHDVACRARYGLSGRAGILAPVLARSRCGQSEHHIDLDLSQVLRPSFSFSVQTAQGLPHNYAQLTPLCY